MVVTVGTLVVLGIVLLAALVNTWLAAFLPFPPICAANPEGLLCWVDGNVLILLFYLFKIFSCSVACFLE